MNNEVKQKYLVNQGKPEPGIDLVNIFFFFIINSISKIVKLMKNVLVNQYLTNWFLVKA